MLVHARLISESVNLAYTELDTFALQLVKIFALHVRRQACKYVPALYVCAMPRQLPLLCQPMPTYISHVHRTMHGGHQCI